MGDIEDIEDLSLEQDDDHRIGRNLPVQVGRKIREPKATPIASEESADHVPGTQTVWVKTFGCSHNVSDSEYMMGQLQDYGYR